MQPKLDHYENSIKRVANTGNPPRKPGKGKK